MAEAIISGLIRAGHNPSHLSIIEIDPERRQYLVKKFGVAVTDSLADGVVGSEIIVLAIKPQQLQTVALALAPLLEEQLIISIAAGVVVATLKHWLNQHPYIVRVMPNTPALIGQGMAGLYAMSSVKTQQKEQAAVILSAVGSVVWVDEENKLDAVTALSGCGPAYVFYFLEAMQQAGAELGLAPETAKQLALQTFLGATQLAAQSEESVTVLRERVTSKGGVTERALLSLEKSGVKSAFVQAMRIAYHRSQEMSEQFGQT